MTSDRQHEHLVVERAALWCSQLPHADVSMRREFVRWLKQSPMHVREMLFANALELELSKFDPERTIDLDELFTRAASNVTPLLSKTPGDAPESVAKGLPKVHDDNGVRRRRWIHSSMAGMVAACAVAAAVLFGFQFQAPRDADHSKNPHVITLQSDAQRINVAAKRVTDTIPPPPPNRK